MAPTFGVNNLNCSDLPEAALSGGSGPLSRRVGYRSDRAKFRVKTMALPTLPENLDEFPAPVSSEQVPSSWPCPACTFVNSGLLSKCEMCETPSSSETVIVEAPVVLAVDAAMNTTALRGTEMEEDICTKNGSWPSLTEAVHSFVDCEVSSVASSWQDVGDTIDFEDVDGDVLIVTSSKQPTAPPSWAVHARSIAASGPAVVIPAAGVAAPPLRKVQPRKVRVTKDVDTQNDANWELDDLEDRRLCVRQFRKKSPPHRRKVSA